jgi:hypothetical protein
VALRQAPSPSRVKATTEPMAGLDGRDVDS